LSEGGKNGFFHGKNRTGKNTFCWQKKGFARSVIKVNLSLEVFTFNNM